MRSQEEIHVDIDAAISKNNAEALLHLADELQPIGTPAAQAAEHIARASADKIIGDFTSALSHYDAALQIYKKNADKLGEAKALGALGMVHSIKGEFPTALEFYHSALAICEELDDQADLASQLYNIGLVHNSTGDYPAALEFYHRSLGIYESLKDHTGSARVTGSIGTAHANSGNRSDALAHYNSALKMHEEQRNAHGIAQVIGNLGTLHVEADDYPAALEDYRRALALHEELNNHIGVAYTTGNIGFVLLDDGQIEEARELFETFEKMEINDPRMRIIRHTFHARLLEQEGQLNEANTQYLSAIGEAEQYGLRAETSDLHMAIRDLAEKRNDFASYIEHNNAYTKLIEEIKGKEATLKMAMQQKQREIESIERDRDRERAVLYSTLPKHVADRVVRGEQVTDHFDVATVLFLDIVGFTKLSDMIPAEHVVNLLEGIFRQFDRVCTVHGLTKVKTIGDSYLAVSGIPDLQSDHADRAAKASIDMLKALSLLPVTIDPALSKMDWFSDVGQTKARIGLHCGPVVAGIVGTERLQYDIWGDTVNTASRMESTGEPGRVQASQQFVDALTTTDVSHTQRGLMEVKGKGSMMTYWLTEAQ